MTGYNRVQLIETDFQLTSSTLSSTFPLEEFSLFNTFVETFVLFNAELS